MSVFGNIIFGLGEIVHSLLTIYIYVVVIAALLSWVRPDPYNPIVQILYRLTEPVYDFVRGKIPTNFGGVDIAPIIIILGLEFIDLFFIKLLYSLA